MNIKKIVILVIAMVICHVAMALDKIKITGLWTRQRCLRDGIVDISFKRDSQPTNPYQKIAVAIEMFFR